MGIGLTPRLIIPEQILLILVSKRDRENMKTQTSKVPTLFEIPGSLIIP